MRRIVPFLLTRNHRSFSSPSFSSSSRAVHCFSSNKETTKLGQAAFSSFSSWCPGAFMSTAEASSSTTASSSSSDDVARMSVNELRQEIRRLGCESRVFPGLEKSDLVDIVVQGRAQQQQQQASSSSSSGAAGAGAAAGAGGGAAAYTDADSFAAFIHGKFPNAAARAGRLRYGRTALCGNTRNPTAIVSLVHGLGDTCDGWASAAEMEMAPHLPHVVFFCPTAAEQPVTINMRQQCRAWYDILQLGASRSAANAKEDDEGVAISILHQYSEINKLAERFGIGWDRIVLSGFSQGGACSAASGLTIPSRPAGIAILSGYLASREFVLPNLRNKDVPIWHGHGTADPMVPAAFAEASKQLLEQQGVRNYTLKTYRGMAHSTNPAEMRDYIAFLREAAVRRKRNEEKCENKKECEGAQA